MGENKIESGRENTPPATSTQIGIGTPAKWLGGITAALLALTALLAAWEGFRDKVCSVGISAPWCGIADNDFDESQKQAIRKALNAIKGANSK